MTTKWRKTVIACLCAAIILVGGILDVCAAPNVTKNNTTNDTTNIAPVKKPSMKSITLGCYDDAGKKIGEDVTCNVTSSETMISNLPSYTSSVWIQKENIKFADDAPGELQKMQVKGFDYPAKMMMIRGDLEGDKTLSITAVSTDGGQQTAEYTFSFKFPSTKLDGQNDNFLVDANGQIPKAMTFATTQKSDGTAFNAVKNSLSTLGGSDQFKTFDVESKVDGKAFELKPGKTVVLQFSTKGGYEKAKLFYAELSGETAKLTEVTDVDRSTAGFLSCSTSKVNGLYVLAIVKTIPDIPVLESFTYSSKQKLADIMLPEVSGGTWTWDEPETVPTVAKENYPATFTADENSEFDSSKTMIKLTITKAEPKILTISGTDLTYGQTLAESTITGTTLNKDYETLTGTYSWVDESVYPIVISGGYDVVFHPSDPNYTEAYGNASLIVTPKQIKANVNPASKTYGDKNPEFTYTLENGALVANDTKEMLNISLSCAADVTSAAGKYKITGSADAENYKVIFTNNDLTINKRSITVIPDDVVITYGDAIPEIFMYSADGLVNGDTPDKLDVTLSSNADASSPAGKYIITGEASSDNYNISLKKGELTINPVVMSQTKFGVINKSSLSNDLLNKLTVTGSINTTDKSRIVVTDIGNTSEAYKAFVKHAPSQKQLLLANISLEGVTGINGAIQVDIPVDSAYNGTPVTVLHYIDKGGLDQNNKKATSNKVDVYTGNTVKDGIVSVKAYSASSFAVVLTTKESSTNTPTTTPKTNPKSNGNNTVKPAAAVKTGDENALAGPVSGMFFATIVLTAVVVFVSRKRKI